MGHSSASARPERLMMIAVDPVAFTVTNGHLHVVLWQRASGPEAGSWALPGVFYHPGEGLDGAARRGLAAKVFLRHPSCLDQVAAWDHVDRDPRGHVVSVIYYALTEPEPLTAVAAVHEDICVARVDVSWGGTTGGKVRAFEGGSALDLAFDHAEIIGHALKRLRSRLLYANQAVHMLPARFTLRQLQVVHEAVLGRPLNTDSFRRSVTRTTPIVEPTGEYVPVGGSRRVAELYRPVQPAE